MTAHNLIDTVKDAVTDARSKAELVGAHSRGVLDLGSQTLQTAKDVIVQGGRDAVAVLVHTREELKRTLNEGVAQMGERLSRIATPTRKEEALARKTEVKDKKRQKRAAQNESAELAAT